MKGLLKILADNTLVITPMLVNQLKKLYPKLYKRVRDIYHWDWDRYNGIYDEDLKLGVVKKW